MGFKLGLEKSNLLGNGIRTPSLNDGAHYPMNKCRNVNVTISTCSKEDNSSTRLPSNVLLEKDIIS